MVTNVNHTASGRRLRCWRPN